VVSLCSVIFIKKTEYLTSTFDIHDSIFDIRFFRVSSSIKLAAFQASGAPDPAEHLNTETCFYPDTWYLTPDT